MVGIYLGDNWVGEVEGDKYFSPRVFDKHYYFKGQGYPISVSVLDDAKSKGAKFVVIIESRKGEPVRAFMAEMRSYDILPSFQERGFDLQKCVPLRYMKSVQVPERFL